MKNQIISNLVGTLQDFFQIEGGLEGKEISTPDPPGSGDQSIYPKSDGNWYKQDDEGNETLLGGSGSSAQAPLGTIILSYTGAITGAATLSQIRAAGFAVCDGTSASSQGISDATITDAMPDLNGDGRFLRGHDDTAGTTGSHQLETHTHTYYKGSTVYSNGSVGSAIGWGSSSGNTGSSGSTETRPINISVVCCMKVK
jgi:hypothetical protein